VLLQTKGSCSTTQFNFNIGTYCTGAACFFCFSVGLVFTTGAGEYWLTLFDNYGAMGLTLIGLAEIMAVMYVYGHKKFTQDVEDMTGIRPGKISPLGF
jgi:solute carrier family 6 amino acid/orphan transporter-like 15/16/17/18/20